MIAVVYLRLLLAGDELSIAHTCTSELGKILISEVEFFLACSPAAGDPRE